MKNKLTKCKTCSADIAKNAKSCPSCGAKNKKGHPILALIVLIFAAAVIVNALSGQSQNTKVTLEKFNSIENGMTYEQVVNIIGDEGELGSQVDIGMGSEYKTELYTWSNPSGSNMNATFQGGKLVAKAQVGLK